MNILGFHVFVAGGAGLFDPVLLVICALAAFLLWSERRAFGRLVAAER